MVGNRSKVDRSTKRKRLIDDRWTVQSREGGGRRTEEREREAERGGERDKINTNYATGNLAGSLSISLVR